MPKVRTFICRKCPHLKKVPSSMKSCEVFKISGCRNLKLLPKQLLSCKTFTIDHCPKVSRLPLLSSWSLYEKNTVSVEVEHLFRRPIEIIQKLGWTFFNQERTFSFHPLCRNMLYIKYEYIHKKKQAQKILHIFLLLKLTVTVIK